jgi:hypothetical protein
MRFAVAVDVPAGDVGGPTDHGRQQSVARRSRQHDGQRAACRAALRTSCSGIARKSRIRSAVIPRSAPLSTKYSVRLYGTATRYHAPLEHLVEVALDGCGFDPEPARLLRAFSLRKCVACRGQGNDRTRQKSRNYAHTPPYSFNASQHFTFPLRSDPGSLRSSS